MITYHQCCLVLYITNVVLKYTTISYFMYNVCLSCNGDLDVIKSAIEDGSVHVNTINEVRPCYTYNNY